MDFDERFDTLNDKQRLAVTTIDGPLMVVAGPGTGKTELLGMRAANILRQTDALPENILCLTFTDAGSIAMQKRLREIIGREASKVSVFTFHSFGTEIMGRYREYFYNGANFAPADNLRRHAILTDILDKLDYNDPLKARMNGKYTAIKDILKSISDLKRGGLTSSEFQLLLNTVQGTLDIAGKILSDVFASRVSTKTFDNLTQAIANIELIAEDSPISGMPTYKSVLVRSLQNALSQAAAHEKTTPPITAWKSTWMTKDHDGGAVLKTQKNMTKLRSLCNVYSQYLESMQKNELLDYDDMIMQVVHAIEVNDDLRFELQEKYQYIMVDEFQDTNMAQMRILNNLTNNPVNEGRPNILVVGDDDQAIYGFQGADVGNIMTFRDDYPMAKMVVLTQNYRSVQQVLDGARQVISQGSDRLETHIAELDKQLESKSKHEPKTLETVQFDMPHSERDWVASSVKDLINSGVSPGQIAIIGRKHNDLISLLSYLTEHQIPISYDKRDDILEDEVIQQLELVGRVVHGLSVGDLDEANSYMPELLTHPAWGITPQAIWEISLAAHKTNQLWLEIMSNRPDTDKLYKWIISTSAQAMFLPLERTLDLLIGNETLFEDYTSPLKQYFFATPNDNENIAKYTSHLENLSTLRRHLREHSPDESRAHLANLLEFIDENRATETKITSYRRIGGNADSVQLMSAHGSKGLEFDHVFIVNTTDTMWGESARSKSDTIAFPENMRLKQNTGDYDERLRLFYVAMTRAKVGLHMSYSIENDAAKEVMVANFLLGNPIKHTVVETHDPRIRQQAAKHQWYAPIINIPRVSMADYLAPVFEYYKISATHINSFVDVTSGGPQHFLLNSLLHFPSAPSLSASFGTVIHATLQRIHDHLRATGKSLPDEDILNYFEQQLGKLPLTDDEFKNLNQRGCDALRAFLASQSSAFNPNQQAEINFRNQGVTLESARLTGKLDVVEFDKQAKTAIVIDYKTGNALTGWGKGSDWDKVKAHKYRQQLLFYQLLIQNSRDWNGYRMERGTLQFVEPTKSGQIASLELLDIPDDEYETFKQLVMAIWQHIVSLTFPDTSGYEQNIKGIKAFEHDILTGKYL